MVNRYNNANFSNHSPQECVGAHQDLSFLKEIIKGRTSPKYQYQYQTYHNWYHKYGKGTIIHVTSITIIIPLGKYQ